MDNDGILAWLAAKATWHRKGVRHSDLSHCLNCNNKLLETDLFCPTCGQKVHESKLTVWSLISEFFAGIFNLDNGFYRSIRYIGWPAYLTREFMEGRRKKYLNPIRFFLVALVIHIAVINYISEFEGLQELSSRQIEIIGKQEIYDSYARIRDSSEIKDHKIYEQLDSTVFRDYSNDGNIKLIQGDMNVFGMDFAGMDLQRKDVFEMPLDDLQEKYKIEGWMHQLVFSQFIRAWRDPLGAARNAIGAILWGVLLAIFLTGLFMKLLYIRGKQYYVEHLILLFHIHTFSFIIASIGFALAFLLTEVDEERALSAYSYVVAGIYFFAAIKGYYKQGWFKSILKFLMISLFYLIVLLSAITFAAAISLLLFK